jgi:DNA helicase HerA-like ATPase
MSIKILLALTDDTRIGETSSSEYSAEGGTPTFDRIPFRVKAGQRPNLNTFVIALRQNDENMAHYGRIIAGSELNLRARPAGMQKDDAYGMPRADIRPSELSPDLVRVMEIELLGELHVKGDGDLEITEPRQLPHTGQPVYELPAQVIPMLLDIPEQDGDSKDKPTSEAGLYLGKVESGGHSVSFFLPTSAIARHIAVLGKTGVGKSYAVGVLMEELYDKKIPMLSFDVLGDTEQTAKELKGKHIIAGTDDFKIPYSIVGLEEFLAFIPNLTSDQRDLIASAYGIVFDEALERLERGQDLDISFSRLTSLVESIGQSINSRATPNAVRRVQAALSRSALLTDRPVKWTELLATFPLINIYVGHLGQWQRNLAVGAAARILQRLRRRNHVPPFVLIIDEAHLFLPGGSDLPPSTLVLREMIRTARHDSVGVVLLSQSPSSMDRQILLTCNTRMLFALDPEDLRVVAGQIGDLPEETIKRIPRMARGTAVFTSGMDIMRHAVIVKIRERTFTSHVAETPDLREAVAKWRKEHQTR